MKHVFCINSNTTFITALLTIQKKKIPSKKVVFLTTRNMDVHQSGYKNIKMKQLWSKSDNKKKIVYLKGAITWVLWYLRHFQFNHFNLYIPSCKIYPCYLLLKLSLVKNFYFLDEGLLYYTNTNKTYEYRNTYSFLKFIILLFKGIPYSKVHFLSGANGTFVLSKIANKNLEKKTVLNIKQINQAIPVNKQEFKKESILIVIDGLAVHELISISDYQEIIKKISSYIATNYPNHEIFYKMHPAYYSKPNAALEIKEIITSFLSNQSCRELSNEVSLEGYLGKTNITMITGFSTIGFLCYLTNTNFISYLGLYLSFSNIKERILTLPKNYLKTALHKYTMLSVN